MAKFFFLSCRLPLLSVEGDRVSKFERPPYSTCAWPENYRLITITFLGEIETEIRSGI